MDRIEKLKTFLLENPTDSFLQHALGLEYIKIGDEVNARHAFESILQREPGYVGTYYHLARLLERIGKSAEALPVYEKGMVEAKLKNDNHAYNELMMARDDNDFYEF